MTSTIPHTAATTAGTAAAATPAATGATATTARNDSINAIVDAIRRDLAAEFHARLRAALLQQPTEWLVDALLARMAAGEPAGGEGARSALPPPMHMPAATPAQPGPVPLTLDGLAVAHPQTPLDESAVHAFIARCKPLCRERLETDGYLREAPCKGSTMIAPACRTPKGEQLLREAKDMLDALLFGDASSVRLARVQRELLTIAVARAKAEPLTGLLRAATAIEAEGTWRDPERVSHDQRAPNMVIEVEYGEVASELVGNGIALALRLINDLEINEQVLYARMENIEESSLVTEA